MELNQIMELNQKNTALLVFSLSAEMESIRKSIFNGPHQKENTAFFKLLIQQTKDVASCSGVDVFWMDEHQQSGQYFSDRFANAFQNLFDAGYENVVSIGNDCPDLSHVILRDAITGLNANKVVLGPSKDGGVYLLGLNKAVFDRSKFMVLPWQTAALKSGLETYFNSQGISLAILDELMDLDTLNDVSRYATNRPKSNIDLFFRSVLSYLKAPLPLYSGSFLSSYQYTSIGLRAPPTV